MRTVIAARWWGGASFLIAALLLLAAACFFSYRGGCAFDGKQGVGDAAIARHYDSITNGLFIAELACLVAAILFIPQRPLPQRLAIGALAVMLAAPLSVYLMLEAQHPSIVQCM
jgi:hypothetical protein